MALLVVNCGSSSLKFELRDAGGPPLARGQVSGIGARSTLDFGGHSEERPAADHAQAVSVMVGALRERGLAEQVSAVSHRIVHGGMRFSAPVLIDEDALDELRRLAELAPLHNGRGVAAVEAVRRELGPKIPMVASFDTAFHAGMPAHAASYALPYELAERHHIRRYGFHGLAHRYMAERFAELRGQGRRLITLQLGAGCSAAAVAGGRSLDTSMGLTPLEGLVMATRSGDVDPALPAFLEEHEGIEANEAERILNERSGLLGVSGRTGDMRELLRAEADGDRHAGLAVELFCYRARKYVGAYLAVLGGADAVLFGGGVGENAPQVRARICAGMAWCGLELDGERNERAVGEEARIDAGGPVEAWVLPVDEAEVMARDAEACLGATLGRS